MTTWADIEAKLDGVFHTTHIIYTVQGTAMPDPEGPGYPADLARVLNPNVWTWQPVGNYPASAFPMQPSINAGEAELVRLITEVHPDRTFGFIGYSQGAIITSNVYDRLRNGDLQQFNDQFIGGVTWGNPRREKGHTIPGGIDPGGSGIVTPNLVNTEDKWWDFACGSKMVGSPGNDLYTTCGVGVDAQAVEDERAIWKIVDTGSFSSILGLAAEVLKLLPNPIKGGIGAVEAILNALDFFAVKGITPHTSYQFVQPIPGDNRDCWRVALDYLNWLGATVPARIGRGPAPAPPAPAPAPAVVTPTPAPVPAPAVDPAPTNNGSSSVNIVETIIGLLKKLPTIKTEVVAGLTAAGSVVGVIETVAPHTSGGLTTGLAAAGAAITWLTSFLNNKVVESVLADVSKL